ncbi:leucine-rich repeat-containing protein 71 [Discoglossus pictus]
MGKKAKEKVSGGKAEDDARNGGLPEKEPVTFASYQCTGDLEQDYTTLCTLVGYTIIPKIICYPPPQVVFPPDTPAPERVSDDSDAASQKSLKSDKSQKSGISVDSDKCMKTGQVTQNILELIETRFSSLKPSVQVEWESKNGKMVRKVSVRGWKIEEKMIGVFEKFLPSVPDLHTISLWNVGLTDKTFSSVLTILPKCPDLKVFALEGNPLPQQSYHKLLSDDLPLAYISLRNNQINNEGARLISQAIQGMGMNNRNLVSLVLSFNHISDDGAGYLAEALRFNRSLLILNLSSNRIGDKGALALAEVLGHFALTHKELVERRRILMEKAEQEMAKSPIRARRTDSKSDRSQSHLSNHALDKAQAKSSKGSPKKKEKEPPKKEEKPPPSKEPPKKEEAKPTKKQTSNTDQKNVRLKPVKSASRHANMPEPEPEAVTQLENINPLLEPAESKNGKVYLMGNKVLVNLNLLRNKITEIGLRGFLTTMETQVQEIQIMPGTKTPTGLLRLSLGKNSFPADNETFLRIQEIMQARDPLQKTSAVSVEGDV